MHSQLPGYVTTKTANATGWLLVVALFSAAGFVILRYAPTLFKEKRADTPPRAALNLSMADTEDLKGHLDNAIVAQKAATATLDRSHAWLDRALPSLDDRPLAARRLELARSAAKSAQAHINRAQAELDIVKTILTERGNKQ